MDPQKNQVCPGPEQPKATTTPPVPSQQQLNTAISSDFSSHFNIQSNPSQPFQFYAQNMTVNVYNYGPSTAMPQSVPSSTPSSAPVFSAPSFVPASVPLPQRQPVASASTSKVKPSASFSGPPPQRLPMSTVESMPLHSSTSSVPSSVASKRLPLSSAPTIRAPNISTSVPSRPSLLTVPMPTSSTPTRISKPAPLEVAIRPQSSETFKSPPPIVHDFPEQSPETHIQPSDASPLPPPLKSQVPLSVAPVSEQGKNTGDATVHLRRSARVKKLNVTSSNNTDTDEDILTNRSVPRKVTFSQSSQESSSQLSEVSQTAKSIDDRPGWLKVGHLNILPGDFNQFDGPLKCSLPCVPISTAAIIYISFLKNDPTTLTVADINKIMQGGDELCAFTLTTVFKTTIGRCMKVADLPREFQIFGATFRIASNSTPNGENIEWRIGSTVKTNPKSKAPSLSETITEFFQLSRSNLHGLVVIANAYARSILKYGAKFYVFDSHGCHLDKRALLVDIGTIKRLCNEMLKFVKKDPKTYSADFIRVEAWEPLTEITCASPKQSDAKLYYDAESSLGKSAQGNMTIIQGTKNQNDIDYDEYANTCVANSVMAIIAMEDVEPLNWTPAIVDQVLDYGYLAYGQSVETLNKKSFDFLEVGEVKREVASFGHLYTFRSEGNSNSKANKNRVWKSGYVADRSNSELITLKNALDDFFHAENYLGGVIICNGKGRAVIHKGNYYCIFDSHPITKEGRPSNQSDDPATFFRTENFASFYDTLLNLIKDTFVPATVADEDGTDRKELFEELQFDLDYVQVVKEGTGPATPTVQSVQTKCKLRTSKSPLTDPMISPTGIKWTESLAPPVSTSARIEDPMVANIVNIKEKVDAKPIKTSYGHEFKVHDGYLFIKNSTYKNPASEIQTIYYKCRESLDTQKPCPVRLAERSNGTFEITSKQKEHNHGADKYDFDKRKARELIKEVSSKNPDSAPRVLLSAISKVNPFDLGGLTDASIIKTIQREIRKRVPKNEAKSVKELKIPENYKFTWRNDPFLQYDSGSENDWRVLIFADHYCLERLSKAPMIMWDGTFKSCPSMFDSLSTLHISFPDVGSIPMVYILLTDRKEETYAHALSAIRGMIRKHSPSWDGPETFLSDFELSFMQALRRVFPNSTSRGCNFHLGQAIYRKINSVGLSTLYQNDKVFSLRMRTLAALAYLPESEVRDAFARNVVSDYYFQSENGPISDQQIRSQIEEVIDYFNSYYVGVTISLSSGRKYPQSARYDVSIWSSHQRTIQDQEKSINKIEGWHQSFNKLVKPGIDINWFFHTLILHHEDNLRRIYNNSGGDEVTVYRKKYQQLYKAIKKAVVHYVRPNALNNVTDFLEKVAYRIRFKGFSAEGQLSDEE